MTRQAPCFDGILPKPTRKLVGKKVLYYLGASDRQFVESRTPDTAADVVASEGECRKDLPVAPFVTNASVTVFPSLPAGFAVAGISTGTAVAIGAGAAAVAGGGIAVASKGGGNGPPTPPTSPSPPPSTPPDVPPTMPSTPPSTPPVTGENRPPTADFRVSPDPPEGASPLDVTFNMCRSTDPDGDELKFTFDYGDGSVFRGNCRTTHTYPYPPGAASVVATICVGDGLRGHDSCQSSR
jgi:PKD domain